MSKRIILTCLIFLVSLSANIQAQEQTEKATTGTTATATSAAIVAISSTSTPLDLARAAFMAQGGEKFRNVQNMVLRGSVNLYPPNSIQSIPGGFSIITAGDKMRMEIDARPAITFKQIYDGQQSYSSLLMWASARQQIRIERAC